MTGSRTKRVSSSTSTSRLSSAVRSRIRASAFWLRGGLYRWRAQKWSTTRDRLPSRFDELIHAQLAVPHHAFELETEQGWQHPVFAIERVIGEHGKAALPAVVQLHPRNQRQEELLILPLVTGLAVELRRFSVGGYQLIPVALGTGRSKEGRATQL